MTHKPTKETTKQVKEYSQYGVTQEKIASSLGISVKTLMKHYKETVRTSSLVLGAEIAGLLVKSCRDGNVQAQIFFMKTRMGWREIDRTVAEDEAKKVKSIKYVIEDASKAK